MVNDNFYGQSELCKILLEIRLLSKPIGHIYLKLYKQIYFNKHDSYFKQKYTNILRDSILLSPFI